MVQWLMQHIVTPYPNIFLGVIGVFVFIGGIGVYLEVKQAILYSLSKRSLQKELQHKFSSSLKKKQKLG